MGVSDDCQTLEPGTFLLIDGGNRCLTTYQNITPATRLGLMRLATQIEGAGVPVHVTSPVGHDEDSIIDLIRDNSGNLHPLVGVGLPYTQGDIGYMMDSSYEGITRVIRAIGNEGLNVIFGGPGITLTPEESLRYFSERVGDVCGEVLAIQGEADLMLPEIITGFPGSKGDPRLWTANSSGVISPGVRQELTPEQLDGLPPVDYDKHLRNGEPHYGEIEGSSRGCPWRCKMCSSCQLSEKAGTRDFSPSSFAERLKHNFMETGRSSVFIVDNDAFAPGLDWWRAFADEVDKDELMRAMVDRSYLSTSAMPTFVQALTEEDLDLLERAGVKRIIVGIQAASKKLSKAIGRPQADIGRILEVAQMCAERGMHITTNMIWGIPGHDDDVFAQELEAIVRMSLAGVDTRCFKYSWLPGSDLTKRRDRGEFADYEFTARHQDYLLYIYRFSGYLDAFNAFDVDPSDISSLSIDSREIEYLLDPGVIGTESMEMILEIGKSYE